MKVIRADQLANTEDESKRRIPHWLMIAATMALIISALTITLLNPTSNGPANGETKPSPSITPSQLTASYKTFTGIIGTKSPGAGEPDLRLNIQAEVPENASTQFLNTDANQLQPYEQLKVSGDMYELNIAVIADSGLSAYVNPSSKSITNLNPGTPVEIACFKVGDPLFSKLKSHS